MAMNIESVENGSPTGQLRQQQQSSPSVNNPKTKSSAASLIAKWGITLMNFAFLAIGNTGGPALSRLYYMHGGSRRWMASWIQSAGFPILFIPIIYFYLRDRKSGSQCFASPKLMLFSILTGVMSGIISLTYTYGLSFLPISTVTLLMSTSLVFTAFFAFFMVKQKFTPYIINTIVLMVSGAVLLGVSKNGDRLPGVSKAQYLLGFLLTLTTAALNGLMLPWSEIGFANAGKALSFPVVLQYLVGVDIVGLIFSTVGMLVKKDFQAISTEASEFAIGPTKYYVILALSAVVWQLFVLGQFGLVFSTSSLTSGIFIAVLLPVTQITSVVAFREKLTGEKVMSMVLCLWGFTSYFYGLYRQQKKQKQMLLEVDDK